MAGSRGPDDRPIPDEWWATYGPSLPTQGSPPSPAPPPAGRPPSTTGAGSRRLLKWVVVVFIFALVVGVGVGLIVVGRVALRPEWLFGGCGVIGGVVSYLIVRGVWGVFAEESDPASTRGAGGTRPLQREVTIPPSARPSAVPPRLIIYEAPVPEGVNQQVPELEYGVCDSLLGGVPEVAELADELLRKCKDNKKLFTRLLEYERSRHPYLTWPELLRLAVEHYDADNR